MKQLIIIGAGPAGISAALYAKRANIDVLVIYMDKSSLLMAKEIENYYGIESISGKELFETGLRQAERLGIELVKDEVISLGYSDAYEVITKNNTYKTKALILANGAYRNIPPVKGVKEYEGLGVSYCAVCDGFFYRQKVVAVLGNGAYAYHEAEYLKNLAKEVIILTNGKEISEEKLKEFKVIQDKIETVGGDGKLEFVSFKDQRLAIDGLFVALGTAGSADLARKIGIMVDENNKIVTDENMRTNVPLIYAVGDTTKGLLQVAKAVYEGALAATDVINRLREH